MRKGVYFSFDAVIASVIFILTIISLLSYWYSVRETIIAEDFSITEEALRISNLLFLPSPSGFGFAVSYENKSLDLAKIDAYSATLMDDIKKDVSTPYDLYILFEVHHLTSGGLLVHDMDYEFGIKYSDDSRTVSKVKRIASTSDGRITVVSVYLYE